MGTKSPLAFSTARTSMWSGTPTQRQLHERRHGRFVGRERYASGDRSQFRRDVRRRRLCAGDGDHNRDSRPGTVGATTLAELEVGVSQTGDVYELNPAAGGTGPLLELKGSAVTAGEFGAGWAPVGAVQTATGYEVAWSLLGQDQYTVWNTDSNGDYTSTATGLVTGQNFTLEDLNPTFGENLNGAPSLSQLLYTQPTSGTTLDLSRRQRPPRSILAPTTLSRVVLAAWVALSRPLAARPPRRSR